MKTFLALVLCVFAASTSYAQDRVLRDVNTIIMREPSPGTNTVTYVQQALAAPLTFNLPVADGSNGQFLSTNGSGTLSWVSAAVLPINVSTDATGVLPIANGGTNKALTLSAGGVPYFDADSFEVLSAGSSGQVLTSGGTGAPTWETVSGTYTPTLTNGTNIASSSANTCMYSRSNLTVTVTCPITVTCTAAAPTQSIIAATIPIASNFTGSQQAIGLAGCLGSQGCGLASGTPMTGAVSADAANDRVSIEFWCTSTGPDRVLFAFWQYRIL